MRSEWVRVHRWMCFCIKVVKELYTSIQRASSKEGLFKKKFIRIL